MVPALLLSLLLLSGPARAEDPPPRADDEAEQAFDEALQTYLEGDLNGALTLLTELEAAPWITDPDLRQRVRVYLGEVQHVMTEYDASFSTFLVVLMEDPGYQLDPFEHPPDVRAHFEAAREEAIKILGGPPEPPEELRLTATLTPGLLQFQNGQEGLGYATAGAVGVLGATAIGLNVAIRVRDQEPGWGIYVPIDQYDQVRAMKRWQNVIATGAGVCWAAGVTQGAMRSRRLRAELGPETVGVNVRW